MIDSVARQDPGLRQAIFKILSTGKAGTQEEICESLKTEGFEVTQSTVSRILRKFGAIRAVRSDGQNCYRLSEESFNPQSSASPLGSLILEVRSNGAILVVKTTPGSASLVARHIDLNFSDQALGTIAGDDTIFVAPMDYRRCEDICKNLQELLIGRQGF